MEKLRSLPKITPLIVKANLTVKGLFKLPDLEKVSFPHYKQQQQHFYI